MVVSYFRAIRESLNPVAELRKKCRDSRELDVYQNGKIVYLIEHANVWYTSTGGIQALNTMLVDLEGALLH